MTMKTVRDLFGSKKFLVAFIAVVAHIAARAGWDVDQEAMLTILSPLYAYIVGQGIADQGKPAMHAAHEETRKTLTPPVAPSSGGTP